MVFLMFIGTAYGQSDLTSPYTLYGPGFPHLRTTVSQAGASGSGIAFADPYKLNIANPAIVAYHLDPIFEISGMGTQSTFSTNEGEFENNSFLLNNLSLSFPIKRGVWGLSLGIVPLTTVGYGVSSRDNNPELESQPVTEYSGDGGISQAYIGTGYKIYGKIDSANNVTALALGANLNYNFGTVNSSRMNFFPEDATIRGLRAEESLLIRDVNLEFGLHYQGNIIKRTNDNGRYLKFNVGAAYNMQSDLGTERSEYAYTFRGTTGSQASLSDTLAFSDREKGSVRIPTRITVGVSLDYVSTKRARLRFSADYATQTWSEYRTTFSDESLGFRFSDSERYSTGLEFTPQVGSTKYFERIEYRAGFKYEKSSLTLRDTDIDDVGMSFGLTLPIHHRRAISKSTFSIAGAYGKYGTTANGLIQEDYFRIYVGFSFTPHFRNRWFVKPKYD
ncbi:MAG: hypothetical protein ABR574_05415 [Cryomorphaceae bacterium]|nr:hypothetical protein [Flavobacteriales bacterium]